MLSRILLLTCALAMAPGAGVGRAAAPAWDDGSMFVGGGECRDCHRVVGHPVGVRTVRAPVAPGVAVLPLGSGDTVECVTCHALDVQHATALAAAPVAETAPPRAASRKPGREAAAALRLPKAQLCARCHDGQPTGSAQRFHALAVGRAHTTAASVAVSGDQIDGLTRQCLSCHDGSAARSVVSANGFAATGHQPGHEAGVSYRDARRRAGLELRAELAIPQPVQLFDGRVGCGSCHSVYSHEPKLLHLPMRDSLLCRACHDM